MIVLKFRGKINKSLGFFCVCVVNDSVLEISFLSYYYLLSNINKTAFILGLKLRILYLYKENMNVFKVK